MPKNIDMTSPQHYASLEKAWSEYKEEGNLEAREFIIRSYTPMVDRLAKNLYRKRPWIFDLVDLRQAGFIGLMEAVNKFEPSRGILFSTFAPRRITGSILDEINSMDWTPRSVREKIRAVLLATERHYADHQHAPSKAELAESSGLSEENVALALDFAKKTYISHIDTQSASNFESNDISEFNVVTTFENEQSADVGTLVEKGALKKIVLDAITESCTKEEERVVLLNFYERKSLKDIASLMKISPSKTSALRKSAIHKLTTSEDVLGIYQAEEVDL